MVRLGDMSLIRDAQTALRLCFFESGKLVLDDCLTFAGNDHLHARFLGVVPVLEEQAPHERWWPLAGVVRKDGDLDLIASGRVQRATSVTRIKS